MKRAGMSGMSGKRARFNRLHHFSSIFMVANALAANTPVTWPLSHSQNLSKSHFLPLAGAALIGIAAALLVNPVWLQLGTVAGKRRRRDTSSHRSHVAETHAHDMAYDGQRPDPK